MDIELITANGSRSIDIDPVVRRYQHDIARSLIAEFLMLGGGATGSYALSKSKTDIFLRSLESYINTIVDTLNKQLVKRLWQLNGLDEKFMPSLVAGDVAPHDLKEIAAFLRNLNGAKINVANQTKTVEGLMEIAELPFSVEDYQTNLEEEKVLAEEDRQFNQTLQQGSLKNKETEPEGKPNVKLKV
jgi:phage gp29-like protein